MNSRFSLTNFQPARRPPPKNRSPKKSTTKKGSKLNSPTLKNYSSFEKHPADSDPIIDIQPQKIKSPENKKEVTISKPVISPKKSQIQTIPQIESQKISRNELIAQYNELADQYEQALREREQLKEENEEIKHEIQEAISEHKQLQKQLQEKEN